MRSQSLLFESHLDFAHQLWSQLIDPNDFVVDATCGNGHDTLFLASLGSRVMACDIQVKALESTQERLESAGYSAILCQACHADLAKALPEKAKLVVFNLGYLPGGDKSITTQHATTLLAIKLFANQLAPGGALSITCYPGHCEGAIEERELIEWAASLSPHDWSASHHRWLRHPKSPSLLLIQKKPNSK